MVARAAKNLCEKRCEFLWLLLIDNHDRMWGLMLAILLVQMDRLRVELVLLERLNTLATENRFPTTFNPLAPSNASENGASQSRGRAVCWPAFSNSDERYIARDCCRDVLCAC